MTDHLLKSATAVEVLLVGLEVRGEVVDAGGEESNLYLGGTRIAFVGCVLLNQSNLFVFLHGCFHLSNIFLMRFTQQSAGEMSQSDLVSDNRAHVIRNALYHSFLGL